MIKIHRFLRELGTLLIFLYSLLILFLIRVRNCLQWYFIIKIIPAWHDGLFKHSYKNIVEKIEMGSKKTTVFAKYNVKLPTKIIHQIKWTKNASLKVFWLFLAKTSSLNAIDLQKLLMGTTEFVSLRRFKYEPIRLQLEWWIFRLKRGKWSWSKPCIRVCILIFGRKYFLFHFLSWHF